MAEHLVRWLTDALNKMGVSTITAILSFCVGRLWLDVLHPRIQNLFYRGLYLQSDYTGEFLQAGTGLLMHDHIEVKQKAERVWGTITVPAGVWGKYKFEGTLTNGILRATFESVGRTSTSMGTFLLKTQAGSSELKGWCTEPVKGELVNYEYTWHARAAN